jgi:ribosomal protein S18 acetylase RimI-like enzyme
MEFRKVSSNYVNEAMSLAMLQYDKECKKCRQLPQNNYKEKLQGLIENLFQSKYGVMAFEQEQLIGYLCFLGPWDGFFGDVKGAFSPLGGSAFTGDDRSKTASLLFEKVSEELIKDEICSIAICTYAHDEEIAKSFVMNGFGIRCSDAIRDLKVDMNMHIKFDNISFLELERGGYKDIRPLKIELAKHLSKAPIFFPVNIRKIENWLNNAESRIFVAKENNEIIGYIQVGDEGENFITENKAMKSICGAYFKEEYRNKQVAQGLLNYICQELKSEGISYLGVDCETLNPNALRFWGKYFENYTYSFHRRIDERIIGFSKYLDRI